MLTGEPPPDDYPLGVTPETNRHIAIANFPRVIDRNERTAANTQLCPPTVVDAW